MEPSESIIPVTLCIDVEPDPRHVSRTAAEPWDGYVRTCEYVDGLRRRLEELTRRPARFCWAFRADPQIADAYGSATYGFDRYPRQLATLMTAGDVIGAHVHPYRWTERAGWLQDFSDGGWVEHCIVSSLAAIQRAVGTPCEIFRFGDRWHSTEAMNFIRNCGVRIDLTLEPGVAGGRPHVVGNEPVSGTFVGFEDVPTEPYTPSSADFRIAGAPNSLCAIPLTSAAPAGGVLRRIRRWVEPKRWRSRHVFPVSLWHPWSPPGLFSLLISRKVAAQRRPYLAFAVRTDLGVRTDIFKSVDQALTELLAHPLRTRFQFCTPDELLQAVGWSKARVPQRRLKRPRAAEALVIRRRGHVADAPIGS